MSYEELDRVSVIERVIEKRLTQREAARMLGLTSRQVRRLRRAYERDGPAVGHRLPAMLGITVSATSRDSWDQEGAWLRSRECTGAAPRHSQSDGDQ
jgi:transposase-like protein